MIHELKILPEYFVEVVRGNKTFEVRKDDRPFNVGDELILYEVNCGKYTGRNIKVIITYILRNPDYCKEGYCILGFKQPVKCGYWEELEEYGDTHYRCSVCGEEWYLEDGKPKDNNMNFCPRCGARMDGDSEVKTINRAVVRGKPLDEDCKTANVSKHEFGPNDNRCFCYGLYVPCNDWEIQQKCLECKAYVENAEPPKDGEING